MTPLRRISSVCFFLSLLYVVGMGSVVLYFIIRMDGI